ncbi:MAG: hypothetical protein FJ309_17390 [Planctomycetes bacterium]|nr:hypothetical protein [Planctomycetota bacterium]MBM4013308.1 hypothetical protein [Planctomycetota bacterium]
MRAELGRRPTPTELLHAHYLPHTLRAAHGSGFRFCRAEGDLDASEERVVERFGAWLGKLGATNLNKSYKIVVLRVLLDRDALWDGMEIDSLAHRVPPVPHLAPRPPRRPRRDPSAWKPVARARASGFARGNEH